MVKINGLDVREYPGTKYKIAKAPYVANILNIKTRFEREVGFFFECIDERRKKEIMPIGFFSFVRMIMPIIETVARARGILPEELLLELHVKLPYLAWNQYRDVFLHNDEFLIVYVGDDQVLPGIGLSDGKGPYPVSNNPDHNMLDIRKLYNDLIEYLNNEVKKHKREDMFDVITGIYYLEDSSDPIIQKAVKEVKENSFKPKA